MVEVDLLDFIKNYKRLAKQVLGTDAGKPAEGGLARWKHLIIHGYQLEDDHSYHETENRLRCFGELREILGIVGSVKSSDVRYLEHRISL